MPRGKTKFDRCVKAVRKRGGAYDPEAVCGAMRARGQLNPSDYEAGKTAGEAGISRKDALAAHIRWVETVETRGVKLLPSERRILTQRFNDAYKQAARRNPGRGYEIRLYGERIGWFPTKPRAERYVRQLRSSGNRDAPYEIVKPNPAEAAAEAFKRFHGREPREFVTVTKKIHRHGNLWSLGTLRMLKIKTDRGKTVKLSGFKGAYLAANEQAFADLAETGRANLTQLYIEGGDQSVDLKSFGIDPDRAHEVETLGKAIVIDYHTVKVHLGGEGGDAIYRHKFRTTREGDREVTLRVARYPDVIYRVLDQQLEFSGGSYDIRAEGIDK